MESVTSGPKETTVCLSQSLTQSRPSSGDISRAAFIKVPKTEAEEMGKLPARPGDQALWPLWALPATPFWALHYC